MAAKTKAEKAAQRSSTRRSFGQLRQFRSGRWKASYTGPDGNLYDAPHTFAAKVDAEGWLTDRRREIDRELWSPAATLEQKQRHASNDQARKRAGMTFKQYADEWLPEHRSLKTGKPLARSTRRDYETCLRLHILPTFGARAITSITTADIKVWHDALLPTKPRMRASAYDVLHLVLKCAAMAGVISANPAQIAGASRVRRQREPMVISDDEATALADAMPAEYGALFVLTYCTGLRYGEVTALRRKDVDLRAGRLYVRGATENGDVGRQRRDTAKTDSGVRPSRRALCRRFGRTCPSMWRQPRMRCCFLR